MKYARLFLILISAFTWSCLGQLPAAPTVNAARAQTSATTPSGRVQTVSFQSQLVGKTLPYNVVLPVDYEQAAARGKRYPVLYLLHGLTGHYDNWTRGQR